MTATQIIKQDIVLQTAAKSIVLIVLGGEIFGVNFQLLQPTNSAEIKAFQELLNFLPIQLVVVLLLKGAHIWEINGVVEWTACPLLVKYGANRIK